MRYLVATLILAGCATTYTAPSIEPVRVSESMDATEAEIIDATRRVLVSEGWQITGEGGGTISTAVRNYEVTPSMADCGKTMGLDYLRDNRTETRVGIGVVVDGTALTVRANIEAEYRPGSVSQDITLDCVSKGLIESVLLAQIREGL